MARNLYPCKSLQPRPLNLAALISMRTARMESATRGRAQRIRHLALYRHARFASVMHLGDGIQQHARIGMARGGEQTLFVGDFYQPAQVHHTYMVTDMAHDC
jgi:hypothetical protein